jgi:hypothetical protein
LHHLAQIQISPDEEAHAALLRAQSIGNGASMSKEITMRFQIKLALITGAMALSAAPALAAQPDGVPPANQGTAHNPGNSKQGNPTPGPQAGLPAKAKAYGRYCQGESKQHVDGQKGTPFSQCVTGMAKLANGVTDDPAKACKAESKKHVKGEKGTPYSRCVSAAAKLQEDQGSDEDQD